ncbi:MAG: hypothetical protein WCV85_01665 [Patescibacteria group bacterium]|jgi:hypothetical protein
MSTRVYFKTNELPKGLTFQNDPALFCFLLNGEKIGSYLSLEGGGYYWEFTNSNSQNPNLIPELLQKMVSHVTIVDHISDEAHLVILDPGEHSFEGSTASVRRSFVIPTRGERYDHIEIRVEAKTLDQAIMLFREILAGRKAEKPFYKRLPWWRRLV